MNRLKRCKPVCYINKDEYICIYEEKVQRASQLTNITTIMDNSEYIDYADEIETYNEIINRKVYGKNSYKGINIGTGMRIGHINIDRNEIIPYMKEIQKGNPEYCFSIISIKDDKVELEINQQDILPKSFELRKVKEKEMRKQGYEIVGQFINEELQTVIDFMRKDNFWNMQYIVQELHKTYYIWAHPDTNLSQYSDQYSIKGKVIKEFSHPNPTYICKYIKEHLDNNLFNIEKIGIMYKVKIRQKDRLMEIEEEIKKYNNILKENTTKLEQLKLEREELKNKFPRLGEDYWYINDTLQPSLCEYKDNEKDIMRIEAKNIFESYQICHEVCRKIKQLL